MPIIDNGMWTMAELKQKYGAVFYNEESDFCARCDKDKPVEILAREWVNNALIVVWKFAMAETQKKS